MTKSHIKLVYKKGEKMALKAMKCPNCDANVELDDSRVYGFCSYCGAQIQIREIVELRQSGDGKGIKSYEKLIADGDVHLKFGDYYQAEMVFMEAIREYPANAQGYERAIKTITRDYTLFLEGNQDRVYTLMNKMTTAALPEEKEYYESVKARVMESFVKGLALQRKADMELRVQEYDKKIRERLIIIVAVLVLAMILQGPAKGSLILSLFGLISCVAILGGVIEVILYKIKRDNICAKLDEL